MPSPHMQHPNIAMLVITNFTINRYSHVVFGNVQAKLYGTSFTRHGLSWHAHYIFMDGRSFHIVRVRLVWHVHGTSMARACNVREGRVT